MLNNFIYAKEKEFFIEELEAGNVPDEAIAFIEDTKEIWNRGIYFAGDSFDVNDIEESVQNIIKNSVYTKSEIDAKGFIETSLTGYQLTPLSVETLRNNFEQRLKWDSSQGIILYDSSGDKVLTIKNDGDGSKFLANNGQYYEIQSQSDFQINITYNDLLLLKNSSNLVKGQKYRITDYVTTTTFTNTKSAGHQFDIIVTADSKNTISHLAKAALHEGDTYFAFCDIESWILWYDVVNNSNNYEWADTTNGKGVIYRMIDNKNNDFPYDFKNIMFYDNTHTVNYGPSDHYYYTFSVIEQGADVRDATVSMSSGVQHNTLKSYFQNYGIPQELYNNIFIIEWGDNCYCNVLGERCKGNFFESGSIGNILNYKCTNNTFGNGAKFNFLNSECRNITFNFNCINNTLGKNNYNIFMYSKCEYNTVGNNCQDMEFGPSCKCNKVGNYCSDIYFSVDDGTCSYNTIEDNCSSISLGYYAYSNTFSQDCYEIHAADNSSYNQFNSQCNTLELYQDCCYNIFDSSCSNIVLESSCYSNVFNMGCSNILLKSFCKNNKLGMNCTQLTLGAYSDYNKFGNNCKYLKLENSNSNHNNRIQYYNILSTVSGTSSAIQNINAELGLDYETKVAKNSNGDIKIYCEADLIL